MKRVSDAGLDQQLFNEALAHLKEVTPRSRGRPKKGECGWNKQLRRLLHRGLEQLGPREPPLWVIRPEAPVGRGKSCQFYLG